MSRKAEILAVGTELLLGDIVNSDAAEVSHALSSLGIDVCWHSVVGDNPDRLRDAVEIAKSRADILITTGGLGPTYDDLTKETLASCFGLPLVFHPEEVEKIRAFFTSIGKTMTENNLRQAWLPEGCTPFFNYNGTAPGCGFTALGMQVAMLPGPPRELKRMVETGLIPWLKQFSEGVLLSHEIRVFGMGESAVEAMLHDRMEALTNPTLAPYAGTGEMRLRVSAKAADEAEAESLAAPVIKEVCEALGDLVYAVDEPSLEAVCLRLLTERRLTFAAAESCTGGLIAKRITDLPGASSVFLGGVVSYTNTVKERVLGVPSEVLERFGAVSRETALAMAAGVRERTGADLAVSVTGICGPGTDERNTPVGTGFVGFAGPDRLVCRPIQMGADRERGRVVAASHAFDLLRRWLTGTLQET